MFLHIQFLQIFLDRERKKNLMLNDKWKSKQTEKELQHCDIFNDLTKFSAATPARAES